MSQTFELNKKEVDLIRSFMSKRFNYLETKLVVNSYSAKQETLDEWEDELKICQSLLLKLWIDGL